MAEPSRVIHIRNVGHEISEVSESGPVLSRMAEFLARIVVPFSGSSTFDLLGHAVANAERSAPGGAAVRHGRQARHAAGQEPGPLLSALSVSRFSC